MTETELQEIEALPLGMMANGDMLFRLCQALREAWAKLGMARDTIDMHNRAMDSLRSDIDTATAENTVLRARIAELERSAKLRRERDMLQQCGAKREETK